MSGHDFTSDDGGHHCSVCSASYHCPACNDGCSMMGHLRTDDVGDFYTCQDADRRARWADGLWGSKR